MFIPDSLVVFIAHKKSCTDMTIAIFLLVPTTVTILWDAQRFLKSRQRQRLFFFVQNFPCFNVKDYIYLIYFNYFTYKCLYMNYDNLFMFQSHPRQLKQMFITDSKVLFICRRASPGTWAGPLCRDLTFTKNSIALLIMFYLLFIWEPGQPG